MQQFQTSKSNLTDSQIITVDESAPLSEGQARLNVERFSFTANNITYAVMGYQIKYWDFFPANQAQEQWGMIPVWGYAVVSESKHPDMAVGDRFFGYFPPAHELIVKAEKVSEMGFVDASAHRAHLPGTYNGYRRVRSDFKQADNEFMMLYPLHITAFAIRAMLQKENYYGAEQVLVISASSKTSTGLAYALEQDNISPSVVGLTSARNVDTVKGMNTYDAVFDYDSIDQIDASKATAIVDMSANGELLGKLHKHLGDNMKFCSNVGLTHWGEFAPNPDINRERSEQFFAPTHIAEFAQKVGPKEFNNITNHFLQYTIGRSQEWLKMTDIDGLNGLSNYYPQVCDGSLAANIGLVVVM